MVAWRQAATGEAWQEVRRATEDKWSGRPGQACSWESPNAMVSHGY